MGKSVPSTVVSRPFSTVYRWLRLQSRSLQWTALGITLMTGLSRLTGFVREQLKARYLGTTHEADAFDIAFIIPNMLRRLLGEGALTAAFIPVYARWRVEHPEEDRWHLVRICMNDLLVVLLLVVALGEFLSPALVRLIAPGFRAFPWKYAWTVELNRLMFPFILFISMAALTTAVLNAHRRFVWPAAAPVLFNVAMIGIVLAWAHRVRYPSLVFALGVVTGGFLQWAVQWPVLRRLGFTPAWRLDFRHPGLREVFRLMGPGFFAVGIAQINMAIGQSYASTLGQGAVAALTYASRVQELTIGMIAVAFSTVLLPHLSDLAARGDWLRFRASVTEGVVWVLAWNLAAAVGLAWLSAPIVHALFEYGRFNVESRLLSAGALAWYALATPAYSLNKVLVPGFYAVKDLWTPVRVAALSMLVYALSLTVLTPRYGVTGIAMSSAVAGWTQMAVLLGLFQRRFGWLTGWILRPGFVATAVGIGGMAAWLVLIGRLWPYPYGGPMSARFVHLGGFILPAVGIFWGLYVGVQRLVFRQQTVRPREWTTDPRP
ncbi:Lipid II flippase MurJ [bacterium HR11]|nr:Lipid II flippase MurJ [bacterium HR11]